MLQLSKLIRKYRLLGYTDSIDIQFSSSKTNVGERLQIELEEILDQTYYSDFSPTTSQPIVPANLHANGSLKLSNQRISLGGEESSRFYPITYDIVTDTVSFLPYIGIWDISDYNGVKRIIGPDGKILFYHFAP